MASDMSIMDVPTLAKATWELYTQCNFIAKDAPDGFRDLTTEVGSLQANLRALNDDVGSNTSSFERMTEDRKVTLERCLNACSQTLLQLKDLLHRYQELGVGDSKQFWWISTSQIEELRSGVMVHTCNLSLCMSSIEDTELARIEQVMFRALEEDKQVTPVLDTQPGWKADTTHATPLSYQELSPTENEYLMELNFPRLTRLQINGQPNLHQGHDRPRHASTSSDSMASASDASLSGGTAPASPPSQNTARSLSPSTRVNISHGKGQRKQLPYNGLSTSRAVDQVFWKNPPSIQKRRSVDQTNDLPRADHGRKNVMEAVASAMHQLHQLRLQEQGTRPIRYELQNQTLKPDADTVKFFKASVNEELRIRRLVTSDWLRVATWWLLKARATLANSNRHTYVGARGNTSPSTESKSTAHQAYVDLLKASYILYDVVLKDESSSALMTDENRKSIADLSEGINEELSQFTTIDIPEAFNMRSQNLDIWEPVQPEEASAHGADVSFGLGASRWIAVDQEDAGGDDERVLYRTFVNAGIGGKKFRIRTKGAPYMLLLVSREGESEPKVIICNQSGSLCLEREFIPDDLPPLIHLSNATLTGFTGSRVSEPIPWKFDYINVSISFQFEADLGHFINIPKTYFDAVWQREPIDSNDFTENIIFKSSVEMFEQLKTPNMKPTNPPVCIKSCEVRILERSFGEAWRSIRRMVISPSVAERTPRCMEFFMPLSKVQISREDLSRQVLLKWSDTCQERSDKTDGNYNALHSYVYDGNTPNIGVGLHFRTQQCAENFEKAVLELGFRSEYAWSQLNSCGRIYDVVDTGTEHKQYKAMVLFQNRSSWRYSDVYYLYRDADFIYDHASLTIRFPRVSFTDYISTHVDQLYRAESPVSFSHCDKKLGSTVIELNDEAASRSFLSALSPLYDLVFARRIQSLSTKSKSLFGGSKKSSKGGANLQVWRRGNRFQLAVRWGDAVPDRWLTMTLPSDYSESARESTRVGFPKLPYARGTSLDMMNILARNPRSSGVENREGTISIVFLTAKDREDFLAVLQG